MPFARIHILLMAATEVDALANKTLIESELANKLKFSEDQPLKVTDTKHGLFPWLTMTQVRFNSRTDAEQVFEMNLANVTIAAGSKVIFHICPHEQSQDGWYNCRDHPSAEYKERVKS